MQDRPHRQAASDQ